MRNSALAFLVAHVILIATGSNAQLDGYVPGTASFFGGPPDANPLVASGALLEGYCGYGVFDVTAWPFYNVVGLSPNNPVVAALAPIAPQGACGRCLQVKCDGATCTGALSLPLLIVDTCPTCGVNQLNMAAAAFGQIANLVAGNVDIQYQRVDCSPIGNIAIRVNTARAELGGYIRLLLLDVAGSGDISSVELRESTETEFRPFTNAYGAAWDISNFGAPPFDIRITGNGGAKLIALGAIPVVAVGDYPTTVQFTTAASTPTTPTPTTPVAPAVSPSVIAPPAKATSPTTSTAATPEISQEQAKIYQQLVLVYQQQLLQFYASQRPVAGSANGTVNGTALVPGPASALAKAPAKGPALAPAPVPAPGPALKRAATPTTAPAPLAVA